MECSREDRVVMAGSLLSIMEAVEAVTEAGKANAVVGWAVGPPQLTTQSSIVSKLFSLPGTKIQIRLLAIEFFV